MRRNPTEMVNSIAAVYGEARGSPLFPTIARASAAGLLNLPAQPQFANVAQEAMRGFLLLGAKQQAQAWIRAGAERGLATTRGPSSRSTGWCRWPRSPASTMPSG